MHTSSYLNRRQFLSGVAGASTLFMLGGLPALAQPVRPPEPGQLLTKQIPSTGEEIPIIGMGTWVTFNVGENAALRNQRTQIMREFFQRGGTMIDSSPMYGSACDVIGYGLKQLGQPDNLFSVSKVWTYWSINGPWQIDKQLNRWGIDQFTLNQVHNLVNWENHIKTLRDLKEQGKLKYIGITTSHGLRHEEFEKVMKQEDLDFVQFTYNVLDRQVENRLLPLAQDRGMAVIANMPFRHKQLFHMYQDKPLPEWAKEEADVINWAEFFLKFVVSHPMVTCAIPATSQIPHIKENMGACYGRLPDAATRQKMIRHVENL